MTADWDGSNNIGARFPSFCFASLMPGNKRGLGRGDPWTSRHCACINWIEWVLNYGWASFGGRRCLASWLLHKAFDLVELARKERAIILKAITFASVGAVSTVLDVSVFWTAVLYLGWPIIAANVLSWLFGASCSYVLNSLITFAAESGRALYWGRYLRFLLSTIAGVVCSTTALVILSYSVPLIVAKLLSLLVSFSIDFSLSYFVVFRARQRA